MGQAVEAGVRGGPGRDREGQLVVDQGGERHAGLAGDHHLLVGLGVGDDSEARDLRPGARRGRHRDHRQAERVVLHRHLVVAHLAAAPGQDRDRLGGVDRAAAAEADQAVVVAGLELGERGGDDVGRRLLADLREGVPGNAGAVQDAGHDVQLADLDQMRIGHDQRPAEAEARENLGKLLDGTAADQELARRDDPG
jgi:hypothetical protein